MAQCVFYMIGGGLFHRNCAVSQDPIKSHTRGDYHLYTIRDISAARTIHICISVYLRLWRKERVRRDISESCNIPVTASRPTLDCRT
ncbi:hypothetical protein DTO012A8_5436 [Penicillium roqueforti]|nr:hypothetical protein DTO012A8_5436 [Penicillium roqueforti]